MSRDTNSQSIKTNIKKLSFEANFKVNQLPEQMSRLVDFSEKSLNMQNKPLYISFAPGEVFKKLVASSCLSFL